MRTLLNLLSFIPLLLNAQTDTTYQGIKFLQGLSWEQIKAKAKTEKKYIFLDCYATWCGPCKMMDRDIYPHFRAGYAMNDHFISVKVQMDSTAKDNEEIRHWYADARSLMRTYKIDAFPTYLFFSPDGKLVHQESGYMDLKKFTRMSELARDPQKPLYYTKYELYKKGRKDYTTMGSLAIFTKNLIGDEAIGKTIAKDYKQNYLNKLDSPALITKQHLDFIAEFPELVVSSDKIFALAYKDPTRFDSIKGNLEGFANWIVNRTIVREEITNKVLKNGIAYNKMPDWDQIQTNIARKYVKVNAPKTVLSYKIAYYRNLYKDWNLWAKYKDEMIKAYPPKPPYGIEVYTEINGHGGAWHAFLYCPDEIILEKALEWVDLALKLDGNEEAYKKAAYLDTKANILYKLGKKEEALELEKKALDLSTDGNNSDIVEAYEKMKRGEPTWLTN